MQMFFEIFRSVTDRSESARVFVFFVIYFINIWIMELSYLFECDILECVITDLSENILFLILTGKIVIMRRGCDILSKFLKIIEIVISRPRPTTTYKRRPCTYGTTRSA